RRRGASGPSAIDQLLQRGRASFGGGGGGPDFRVGSFGGWAALAVILLWIVLTSVHTIGPQQRGVITRFGKYVGTLQPGLGMSLPAPIDMVRKIDVDNIHAIEIDNGPAEGDAQGGQNLMLTGDENIIDLAYSVRWNIRDPELYLFELADPDGTIREVAESAMREQVARVSLNDAIGSQRSQIESRVAQRIQELLDGYRAGVSVQGVAIRQADPPSEVMDAFKEVSAAQQQAQSYLNQARAYATQVDAKASGEAIAFDQVYVQYKLAPEVTRRRMYYDTMEKVLAKSDKTIVEAPGVTPYLPIQPKVSPK
ncbi:FtsH protease activity modulator HflK, partial [Sphingomonas bacterium]|uniref:FtsH protease activity modulator HflK n=1 Tax=Sphingomonas bacterium TaxID=1895847 RepID=UPI001575DD5F